MVVEDQDVLGPALGPGHQQGRVVHVGDRASSRPRPRSRHPRSRGRRAPSRASRRPGRGASRTTSGCAGARGRRSGRSPRRRTRRPNRGRDVPPATVHRPPGCIDRRRRHRSTRLTIAGTGARGPSGGRSRARPAPPAPSPARGAVPRPRTRRGSASGSICTGPVRASRSIGAPAAASTRSRTPSRPIPSWQPGETELLVGVAVEQHLGVAADVVERMGRRPRRLLPASSPGRSSSAVDRSRGPQHLVGPWQTVDVVPDNVGGHRATSLDEGNALELRGAVRGRDRGVLGDRRGRGGGVRPARVARGAHRPPDRPSRVARRPDRARGRERDRAPSRRHRHRRAREAPRHRRGDARPHRRAREQRRRPGRRRVPDDRPRPDRHGDRDEPVER